MVLLGGATPEASALNREAIMANLELPRKKNNWSLEDEDEEEDASGGAGSKVAAANGSAAPHPPSGAPSQAAAEPQGDKVGAAEDKAGDDEEEEVDPLDAYMNEVNKEVKKLRTKFPRVKLPPAKSSVEEGGSKDDSSETATKKGNLAVIVTGVARKGVASALAAGTEGPQPAAGQGHQKAAGSAKGSSRGELMEQDQDGLEYSDDDDDQTAVSGLDAAMNMMEDMAKGTKKDLARVNHGLMEYPPFQKEFYVEVPELARLTSAEVEQMREDLEGIKVRGKAVPKPLRTWPQCGVSARVLEVLKRNGYEKPTPIQAQAIPIIMSGRDMIGIAKTGSGKTLAFLLPMIRHLRAQPPLDEGDGPLAIVMAPTRELCMQIGKEVRRFSRAASGSGSGLRCVCVYGGTSISEQIAELKRGAEVIVCTPGRMIDMLAANGGRVTNTRRVTYLVLDEADRMFDMGFEPQVMKIVDNCRPDRQLVMFSATFPRAMEALARRTLQKPIEVVVGGRSVVCRDIEQHAHVVRPTAEEDQESVKFLKLLEILGQVLQASGQNQDQPDRKAAIVFVDKQEHADSLLKDLMNAGYTSCSSLHGGIDQYDRDSTITDFKAGRIQILVATSVAARGLDVRELVLVVNYDCPNHYEDYVHRVGRTGRAGNKGFAHTILTQDQGRYAGEIVKAFELSEALVPADLRRLWDEYKAKLAEEGKTVRVGRSGFGGSGFKFDETEASYTSEKKKFQKTVFGLQDSDDEDVEQELEETIEQLLDPKRSVRTVSSADAAGASSSAPSLMSLGGRDGVSAPQQLSAAATATSVTNPGSLVTSSTVADKLELAKRMAARINLKSSLESSAYLLGKTSSLGQGPGGAGGAGGQAGAVTAKSVADQMAARLNAKLNYQPNEPGLEDDMDSWTDASGSGGGPPGINSLPQPQQFQKFEEELVINDFPQQARWRVTSKEALAQISEYSDAGITVRGTYFPQGKAPPEGERKLFLAIESTNELAVQKAKLEITRLLKEELMKLQSYGIHHINKGRYKVL